MMDSYGFECDGCDAAIGVDSRYTHFKSRVKRLKQAGWVIERVGYFWRHYCPKCQPKPVMPDRQPYYWWLDD